MADVAIASFEFEGNTFSVRRHGRADFQRKVLVEGGDVLPTVEGKALAVTGGIDEVRSRGYDIVPILVAHGGSGGRVEDDFYDSVKEEILRRISVAQPVAGVYLALHGAMVCETIDDPEGDLLAAIRTLVGGSVPVSASLDLHAHVTPAMVHAADVLVGYETYPHEDAYETGRKAARLLCDTIEGRIRPVLCCRKINAMLPVMGGATRAGMPMQFVREKARDAERSGRVLSASYFPVQPWLDVQGTGIAGLAVTDGDAPGALAVATEIVDDMWSRRKSFEIPSREPDDVVEAALLLPAPTVIIVDAPDCIGGGAPGDSPALLAALLRHAPDVEALVLIVDPTAAAAAHAAKIGASLTFRIGSSIDLRWHDPVQVFAKVESLHDGRFLYDAGIGAGTPGNMGGTAVLRVGSIRIVVVTYETYEYGDEQYRSCGIDFHTAKLVSFKNPMNFRNLLGDEVDWLAMSGPGVTPLKLEAADWLVKTRPFWPCDDIPKPHYLDLGVEIEAAPVGTTSPQVYLAAPAPVTIP